MKPSLSLYIHIPFCVKKCAYCDFISYNITEIETKNAVSQYMAALKKEIELYKTSLAESQIKSIFIGGGTPSSINGTYIQDLLETIKSYTEFSPDIEITIEANPGTLTLEKIDAYLKAGINRVSMGLQTTNNRLLTQIGRIHNLNDFETSYQALIEAGINNISVDMMFGLPGQTLDDINHTLATIRRLKPKHVSAYALKLEEGTPMYEDYQRGAIGLPDEETEREMYHTIQKGLETLGYHQYEISNFALEGYESRHNLVYWENEPYLGLGISSHSKVEGVRFANETDILRYISKLNSNEKPVVESTPIDAQEDLFETIMLGLRLNKGLDIQKVNAKYEIDFYDKYKKAIDKLLDYELVIVDQEKGRFKLTDKGLDLSNSVFVEFIED